MPAPSSVLAPNELGRSKERDSRPTLKLMGQESGGPRERMAMVCCRRILYRLELVFGWSEYGAPGTGTLESYSYERLTNSKHGLGPDQLVIHLPQGFFGIRHFHGLPRQETHALACATVNIPGWLLGRQHTSTTRHCLRQPNI